MINLGLDSNASFRERFAAVVGSLKSVDQLKKLKSGADADALKDLRLPGILKGWQNGDH